MRSLSRRLVVLILVAACGDARPEPDPEFASRTATLEEEIRLDGYAEDFVPITTIAVRDDGVFALNQVQDGRIRFFAADGEPLGSFGARGQGPGEFMNPFRMAWSADTLWVYDGIQRRITFIGPDLELAGTLSNLPSTARPAPEDAGRIPEFPFAFPTSLAPNGSLYASLGFAVNQVVPEPFAGRSSIGRISADGVVEKVILILPPSEHAGVTTASGGSASLPFGNSPRYAMSPRGDRLVIAMATLEGLEAGTFSLIGVSMDGDTLFAHRFPFEAEPLPKAVGDSALEASIARIQQMISSSDLPDALRRDGTYPPLYPPISNILVGNDDSIWLELRQRDDQRPYYVATPDGLPLGTVSLPAGSRVAAAVRDRVWVLEPDDLGIQSVVVYTVRWPG